MPMTGFKGQPPEGDGRLSGPVLQSSRSRSCGPDRPPMQPVRLQFDRPNGCCRAETVIACADQRPLPPTSPLGRRFDLLIWTSPPDSHAAPIRCPEKSQAAGPRPSRVPQNEARTCHPDRGKSRAAPEARTSVSCLGASAMKLSSPTCEWACWVGRPTTGTRRD
jgi:hypothetical protein